MTKKHQVQIQPGLCPPEGCPPFDRIECIVVDKVYDSCYQVDERTREITTTFCEFGTGLEVGDAVECSLSTSSEIACRVVSRTAEGNGFFTMVLSIQIPLTLTNPEATTGEDNEIERIFTFSKTVTLCAPDGVAIDCSESRAFSCNCVVAEVCGNRPSVGLEQVCSNYRISCDIQVCVVVRAILRVQLLVPSYGFCVPAPCTTIPGVCPPLPPGQCP